MKRISILILIIILSIIGFSVYRFNFTNDDVYVDKGEKINSKDTTYLIENKYVTLKNGRSESEETPGSTTKTITMYFGNDATGDLNNDGKNDTAFLLTQNTGGSGTFFYVVAAINTGNGFNGTNAIYLGDRIAPQTTELRDGLIIVNYADRKPKEAFSVPPSNGMSKFFKIYNGKLVEIKP